MGNLQAELFPAHAGVIPHYKAICLLSHAVPRTRGGDPHGLNPTVIIFDCSPHTRG